MSKSDSSKENKFDIRLLEWNLLNGVISQEEVKKHLASLPDLGAQVEMYNLGEDRGQKDSH
jgi:hypothetical protein